jgi:hypothetical protein
MTSDCSDEGAPLSVFDAYCSKFRAEIGVATVQKINPVNEAFAIGCRCSDGAQAAGKGAAGKSTVSAAAAAVARDVATQPADHRVYPWVEQDLVISRALVGIFGAAGVAERLAFRGGTALYKLYLTPAARYSEDIDLVQTRATDWRV